MIDQRPVREGRAGVHNDEGSASTSPGSITDKSYGVSEGKSQRGAWGREGKTGECKFCLDPR